MIEIQYDQQGNHHIMNDFSRHAPCPSVRPRVPGFTLINCSIHPYVFTKGMFDHILLIFMPFLCPFRHAQPAAQ